MGSPIKVLVVDDSALVRKMLTDILSSDSNIEVIHAAKDPYEARDYLVSHQPDVITLDIEMPKMDGVTFLKKLMKAFPTPTVVISSLAEKGKKITIEAMEAGAVDIITKPKMGTSDFFDESSNDIIDRVKKASQANIGNIQNILSYSAQPIEAAEIEHTKLHETTDQIIAIGASTGGVESLAKIMPLFPPATPGIVIVQHMPEGFTASFANRLNDLSQIQVKEAEDGMRIVPGTALIAPGGTQHLKVVRYGGQYRVELEEGEKVSFNRPSVDVMLSSVAKHVGENATSIIMTGMGKDGAAGLLDVKQAGGTTFIQDESTSIIFGMPGEAKARGAAQREIPLMDIPKELLNASRKLH